MSQAILSDLIGLLPFDLNKAENIYLNLPVEIKDIRMKNIPYSFDLCAHLLECVAEAFEEKHGFYPQQLVTNYAASGFYLDDESQEKIEKLAAEGCLIAEFILNN